jgi:hypothetical protein
LNDAKEAELNPKKKYAERMLDKIATDDKCHGIYNGVTLQTSAGICTVKSLKNTKIA